MKQAPPIRTDERGATMFIVLMVIMILSAIGTFAVSNARFEVQTAGYTRQRTVAEQMANLGGFAAMNELGSAPDAYFMRVRMAGVAGEEKCRANATKMLAIPPPPCFQLKLADVESRAGFTSEKLIMPPNISSGIPGSLGHYKLGAGFSVEITDSMEHYRPVAGYAIQSGAQGSDKEVRFLDFTVTSTGVMFPDDNLNGIVDYATGEGGGATFASGRGHFVIGPIVGR